MAGVALLIGGGVIDRFAGAVPRASDVAAQMVYSGPRLGERRILDIALAAANRAGDARPTLIQHSVVATTAAAERLISSPVTTGGVWSYVAAERGRFVVGGVARGARRRGAVLTLVIDARSGRVTHSAISSRYPDLGALGAVRTDRAGIVTEPVVIGLSLDDAYRRLRLGGLRVSFHAAVTEACSPTIARQTPKPGARVTADSTTTLVLHTVLYGLGSPAVPVGRLPSARVLRFTHQPLLAAIAWTEAHQLDWDADPLPPLTNADAPTLLGNYQVITQHPQPGATLTLGIGHTNGDEGSWLPTPLHLLCRQR